MGRGYLENPVGILPLPSWPCVVWVVRLAQQVKDPTRFFQVANFLDISILLDAAMKEVAEEIKLCEFCFMFSLWSVFSWHFAYATFPAGKDADGVRQRFNIVNDFTPEEEADNEKILSWLVDEKETVAWATPFLPNRIKMKRLSSTDSVQLRNVSEDRTRILMVSRKCRRKGSVTQLWQ